MRKDLHEGKYKPDLAKQAEFEQLVDATCDFSKDQWGLEGLEQELQYLTQDDSFKIELWLFL